MCFLALGNVRLCGNCDGIEFRRGRLSYRASSSVFFLLCELHSQRLLQRLVEGLRRLALGTHFCSPKLDCKPHLRFTCFIPRDVENAATVFPRPTRGIVHHTHTDTSAYIDEQSTSDEAETRWRFDVHTLNMKIPQWFSMFWSAAVVCLPLRTDSANLEKCFKNHVDTSTNGCSVDQVKTSQHGLEDRSLFKAPTLLMHPEMGQVRSARLRFQAPTLLVHTQEGHVK